MIELKNVSKFYNNNGVVTIGLRNINLKLNKGEIVAITGDSGSGKSTLLNVITGVDTYEEGEILFLGNETSYFNTDDMDKFRKNNVSFIYQKYNIIESYTVLQNVMLPLIMAGKSNEEAKKQATEIIKKVGLIDKIKNKGTKLSGGEKQRTVIARALASNAKILACDEPTGNLDSETGNKIIELIKEVANDKLVLIVTHNYDQVKDIVTRKIKLSDGEIIEDTTFKSFADDEKEEMDLSTKKIKTSILNKVAMQNVFSTPKKTTLVSLVFLVISLITLVLSTLMIKESATGSSNSSLYPIKDEDRLIIYDENHQGLPMNKINDLKIKEFYQNAFYEDIKLEYTTINKYNVSALATERHLNYDLVLGTDYSKENEYMLILPKEISASRYSDYVDTDLLLIYELNELYPKTINIGTVTGVGKSKDVTTPVMMSYGTLDPKIINLGIYKQTQFLYQEENNYYNIESLNQSVYNSITNQRLDYKLPKTTIFIPTDYKNNFNYISLFSNLYPVTYDLEIVVDDRFSTKPVILYGEDYYYGYLDVDFNDVYEISAYANNKSLINKLHNLNLDISIPSKMEENNKNPINIILLNFFLINIGISLVCLFFVSFAVLYRIYASKSKDYSVLRALGMVKKDLGKIVKIETIFLGIVSSIFSIVVFIITMLFLPKIGLLKSLTFGVLIFYLIVMFIFSYLIARRFNHRLFKFSVNTDLKEGFLND